MLTFEKKQNQESVNNTNAQNFIAELIKCGVRHFCVGSGKRSILLANAIYNHPLANLYKHYDERALGFFALGIAKVQREPIAILVTSGTALANLYPSVIEARMSHHPLIILAANRPAELLDTGSNQTIDQTKMFGHYIQKEINLNFSDIALKTTHLQGVASRLHYLAKTHDVALINAIFKEPLTCTRTPLKLNEAPIKSKTAKTRRILDSSCLFDLCNKINTAKNPLIIVGETKESCALILTLAQILQAPLFLDILSNQRNHLEHPCHIPFYEQIIQSEKTMKGVEPDLVLHFGRKMISCNLLTHLHPEHYLHIDDSHDKLDPKNLVTDRICVNSEEFCQQVIDKIQQNPENTTLKKLKTLSLKAKNHFYEYIHTYDELDELFFFYTLINHPIDEYTLFFGNSMPIRYADALFFPYSQITNIFANRGCSGIDGNIATSLGLHSQSTGPSICILGDLTTLYDFNAFMIDHKNSLPILFIVFNNQQGGIFHHLNTGLDQKSLEDAVSLKHTMDFKKLASAFNLQYFCPEKRDDLESHLICALNSQSALLEIKVNAIESSRRFNELQKNKKKPLVKI